MSEFVSAAFTSVGEHRRQAIDAGFDDHVVKPISLPALLELIG